MKKKNKLFIGGVVVLVLLAGLLAISQPFSVPSQQVPSGSFISVPIYGTLSCLEDSQIQRSPATGWVSFSYRTISCGTDTGLSLSQSCDVNFKLPSESEIGSGIGVKDEGLVYSICTSGSTCSASQGNIANQRIEMRRNYNNREENFNREVTIHLNQGQFLYAEYQRLSPTLQTTLVNSGKFAINIRPYVIWRRDIFDVGTDRVVPNTVDCQANLPEINYAIRDFSSGLQGELRESSILDKVSLRSRGAVLTYISRFIPIVPQFSLFDDDTKYCTNRKIYRVDTVTTNLGTYKVADTSVNGVIQEVECCTDGDVPAGYACENFRKVRLSQTENRECSQFSPCPTPAWHPVDGNTVVRQQCINGQCVTQMQEVECATNEQCGQGRCEFDVNNPSRNECSQIEPVDTCGNGVCEESLGENSQMCPRDCREIPPEESKDYTPYIIIGVALVIIAIMIYAFKGKRRR